MKNYFLIFILLSTFSGLLCQTNQPYVFASSGGNGNNDKLFLTWTVGETFIGELYNNPVLMPQGFHQGAIQIASGVKEIPSDIKIIAYPNPVFNILHILYDSDTQEHLIIHVMDISGKVLLSTASDNRITEIDLSNYPSGSYLLQITNSSEQQKIFNVIKQTNSHEKN